MSTLFKYFFALSFFLFFLTKTSMAQMDARIGTSSRSYPAGLALEGEFGSAYKIWSQDDILYGYVRGFGHLKSSLLVNSAAFGVEFYPVSFFGLSLSHLRGHRTLKNVQGRDCDLTNCTSSVYKNILALNLGLAYSDYVLMYNLKREFIHYKDDDRFFSEEFSGLILTQNDRQDVHTLVVARKISAPLLLGMLQIYSKAKNENSFSSFRGLIGQYSMGKWSIGLSGGVFRNIENHTHGSFIFLLKYNYENGLRII